MVYSYNTYGSYCNNRATSLTVTKTRSGQTNYISNTSFSYDTKGRLTRKIEEPNDPKVRYTDYQYDSFGNITSTKVSPDGNNGRTTTFTFDSNGRFMTQQKDQEGHYINFTSDAGTGKIIKKTDSNNLTTTNTLDGFGRITKSTFPDGNYTTSSLAWVSGGNPEYGVYSITTQASGSPASVEYYDVLGRSIQRRNISLGGQTVITDTRYNSKGQVSFTNLPYFSGTGADQDVFSYDDLGRVTSEIAPGVNKTCGYNGLTTTITDNIASQTKKQTVDASGVVSSATDFGGTITYKYYASGKPSEIDAPGKNITMSYDQFLRQTQLIDPDAGTYKYTYDNYGELVSQIDPKSQTTTMSYDDLGRISTQTGGTFNTTYTYKSNGLTDNIASSNNVTYTYSYDSYGRVISKAEKINGNTYTTSYSFDTYGRLADMVYPSGFQIDYSYQNGYLSEIKRHDTGKSIWKATAMNSHGQLTGVTYGNGLSTTYGYLNDGFIQSIQTGPNNSIQNLSYGYNSNDLMQWRKDLRHNLIENFTYDNGRLHTIQLGSGAINTVTYTNGGNIQIKSDAGTYTYGGSRPNAITQLTNPNPLISQATQGITYTSFNKAATITDGSNSASFTYGPDDSRKMMVETVNGVNTTKYYCDNYENMTQNGVKKELNYITAYGKLVAIFEKNSSGGVMHYVHTDHLGSLNCITNESGAIEQELSFDAWGNRRDPATWKSLTSTPTGLITDRGFTGHEHLDGFGMINMNGRMYDPILGRFLSADIAVQDAGSTQSFNRFSYVTNNPLMFTDPTGYYKYLDPGINVYVNNWWLGDGNIFGSGDFGSGDFNDVAINDNSLFPQMGKNGVNSLDDYDNVLNVNFGILAGTLEVNNNTVTETTHHWIDYYDPNSGNYLGTQNLPDTYDVIKVTSHSDDHQNNPVHYDQNGAYAEMTNYGYNLYLSPKAADNLFRAISNTLTVKGVVMGAISLKGNWPPLIGKVLWVLGAIDGSNAILLNNIQKYYDNSGLLIEYRIYNYAPYTYTGYLTIYNQSNTKNSIGIISLF